MLLAAIALSAWGAAPLAAACLALVEFITFYDNAVVSLGNRLGISPRTKNLNRRRFLLHAVCISLLVPTYAGMGQLLGIAALSTLAFNTGVVIVTAVIAGLGYFATYRPLRLLMPVNYYGCLRYAQSVTTHSRHDDYQYSEAELAQKAFPPLASIVTVLVGLALSVWMGLATDFWIPALVTA
ncbi:MAG: hypothetical protein ACR2QB_05990, partial [Gammaproteobacteria bacterium]